MPRRDLCASRQLVPKAPVTGVSGGNGKGAAEPHVSNSNAVLRVDTLSTATKFSPTRVEREQHMEAGDSRSQFDSARHCRITHFPDHSVRKCEGLIQT